MSSLRDLLQDPLGPLDAVSQRAAVEERLGEVLHNNTDDFAFGLLARFVRERPHCYWDLSQLRPALSFLEERPDQTHRAIGIRRARIDIAFPSLLNPAAITLHEEPLSHLHARELVQIANEYHPEYLRCAEHTFGNVLSVYWSLAKQGSVAGKFRLKNASDLMSVKHPWATIGYLDNVRNAIAHGQVVFTGSAIRYGEGSGSELSSSEFLRAFDELRRTTNALALSLLIFLVRSSRQSAPTQELPISLISLIAAARTGRPGLKLLGAIESVSPLVGRQLHVALKTRFRNRAWVKSEAARTAARLIESGAVDYDRFVFEIDNGMLAKSLVGIKANVLRRALARDAPATDVNTVFDDSSLLWFTEGKWRTRLRAWRLILGSVIAGYGIEHARRRAESDLPVIYRKYRVREAKNLSAGGIVRVRITAVLGSEEYAEDPELLRSIARSIVRRARRRLVWSRPSFLERGPGIPRRPQKVFFSLHRADGCLRWLSQAGWASQNLVLVGEYGASSDSDSVFVKNAEVVLDGIRLRSRIDAVEASEAITNLVELTQDLLEGAAERRAKYE